CSGRVSKGRYPWMTMRSKQWYTKTRKRAKSFSKVPSVPPQAVWLATKIIRSGGRWNQPGLKWSMRSLRLGDLAREKREATMTENAIAKEIVDAAFRIHT